MSFTNILQLIGATLFSTFSAGLIIFGLSSWLGKVWAHRILNRESHKLQEHLATVQSQLDLMRIMESKIQNDKIKIYRGVVDLIAEVLADFDGQHLGILNNENKQDKFHRFNEQRIRLYGYMAMFAPQAAMDAQDKLVDHLLRISQGQNNYVWEDVRNLALNLINEVRRDVGIDKTDISYNGPL